MCVSAPFGVCVCVCPSVVVYVREEDRESACVCLVGIPGWLVVSVVSRNSYQNCDHRKLVSSDGTHPFVRDVFHLQGCTHTIAHKADKKLNPYVFLSVTAFLECASIFSL